MELNFRLPLRPTLFLILIIILSACAPAVPTNDAVSVETSRRASPTPAASSLAAQPTGAQVQPGSIQSPFQARLAVIRSRAKVFRSGGIETEVQQAQSADIQVDEGIEVVKLEGQEEQSYSILSLPDFLGVELFSNTKVFLADVTQEAGGSTDVTLHLDGGHMFVYLNEQTVTQVTVQTPYATIKTLTAGAEIDICRNEERTCVVVKRGVVEIIAQDRKQIVKAGEASQILKDQPPSPPVCAPTPIFIAWEESYRRFADAPALQAEISALPQEPCPLTALGLPVNARILYQDNFSNPASGWDQGKIDNFMVRYVRYSGRRYYQVQVQGPEDQFLAYVPNERDYEDVNVDIRVIAEPESGGDFRYGLVLRRSGDQYYAFAISPSTKTWHFLKSSSTGLETLREGIDKRMRGLDAQDTLRVESYGSTFLFYINGRFIDWVSDSDYASGEVGLFVETIDSPDALISFNSIIIWDMPAPVFNPNQGAGEKCFNASDDDGDGWIDQADPDCQRPELILTSPPTSLPLPTNTPRPTNTARPPTNTPEPPIPTLPLPTVILPLPTLPLPTVILPLPTISLPLPTVILPLPIVPPVETPMPE